MTFNYKLIMLNVVFIFASNCLFAQVDVKSADSNWIRYSQITARSQKVYDEDRFQGDVYLFENWKPALFTMADESTLLIDSVKFNLLRSQVEVTLRGKELGIRGSQYDSFVFSDEKDQNISFKSKHYYFIDGQRLPGIIKTMEIGDYSVLVAYDSEVRELSKENPLMIDRLKKDMVRITKLRYIEREGALSRIKNKRDLLNFFDSDKKIKEFISRNKINHKEEADIAKVVAFFLSKG